VCARIRLGSPAWCCIFARALQEAIEIFEKKIEAMEAERRRTSASSKAQGRGGDFLTSDTLQTMRDTFNMLRDDACVWRLAAAKSLMNGLTDLPAVGARLGAVPPADAEEDASEGAEEQKAADLRSGLSPHQATAVSFFFRRSFSIAVKAPLTF
jgi:hypothetical protein